MRTYETGATRDVNTDKLDYRGFTSFTAWQRFAQYMHRHRRQADGQLRASDNWKKGIPIPDYLESLTRHFVDFEIAEQAGRHEDAMELACAIWFNLQGYMHERLKGVDAFESTTTHTDGQ